MAAPIIPSFLKNLVYPAALTACGLLGNAYILGGQVIDVRDYLGHQIKDMKDDLGGQIKGMRVDLKEVAREVKSLTARQTQMELHHMSVAEKLLKDCGKGKNK